MRTRSKTAIDTELVQPVAAFQMDSNCCILKANSEACSSLGFSADEFQSLTVADIVMDWEASPLHTLMHGAESGSAYSFTEMLRRKDGSPLAVELHMSQLSFEEPRTYQILATDISARRQKEQVLLDSEEQWRSLTENSSDYVMTVDREGRILFINRALPLLKMDDVIGELLTNFIDDERAEEIRNHFNRVFDTGDPVEFHTDYIGEDGQSRYFESHVSPVYEAQEIVRLTIRSTDVTDRKKIESAMRRSEESLNEAQRIGRMGSWRRILATGEVFWSNEQFRLFGYEPGELEPTRDFFISRVHTDDRATALKAWDDLQDGGPVEYQFRFLRKNGEVRYGQTRAVAETDQHGVVVAVRGTLLDVTESVTAKKALEESEQKYRLLVESLNEGIWVINAESVTTFVNPRMADLLGYTVDEMSGRHLFEFMDDEGIEICKRNIERRRSGIAEVHDFRFLRKDGSVVFAILSTTPINDGDGNYCGAIAGVVDVTARRKTETELRDSNIQLEAALKEIKDTREKVIEQERLKSIGVMASGIAHDFNNSLSTIHGFSDLLLKYPDDLKDTEKVKDYLELIRTGAVDAAKVVSRLGSFYRGREKEEVVTAADINELIEQSVMVTRPAWRNQAMARDVEVRIEKKLGKIPRIAANESELREAFINLILNAIDALPEGGLIEVISRKRNGMVIVEVRDDGTGMTDDVRARCLVPFFTTKGERGTGLGLPGVFGVIHRHSGSIEIDTELGAGTTVRLLLPAKSGPCVADHSEPTTSRPKSRVLLVDDEEPMVNLLRKFLAADGHAVQAAANGEDALALFSPEMFDVVITDHAMPRVNGASLSHAIKMMSPSTPVIMVTGFADVMKAKGEVPQHIDLLLSKPVRRKEFQEALASVLSLRPECETRMGMQGK